MRHALPQVAPGNGPTIVIHEKSGDLSVNAQNYLLVSKFKHQFSTPRRIFLVATK
jgi:hypothetical protein